MTYTKTKTQTVIEGEVIRDQASRAASNVPLIPRPPGRGIISTLINGPWTLEDDTEYFRQLARRDGALVVALDARASLVRKIHELGQLPLRFARDDEIRDMEHEYQREQMQTAIEQMRAERAKATAAIAKARKTAAELEREAEESTHTRRESQEFADEIRAYREMERIRDEAIAEVRRSRASAAEKEERIRDINARFERKKFEE